MELSELIAYAEEKYNIREQQRHTEFPGLSVLINPRTGKLLAMLMRQWDYDTGFEIQLCDFQAVPYPAFLKNPVSKFLKTAYFKQQSETRNLKCSLCSWQGEHFIALSIAQ